MTGTVVPLPETLGTIRADGTHGAAVDLSLAAAPNAAITAGTTWHFQGWFRDLDPGRTTNLTEAIAVMFE